jgi:hypothetical protein
VRVRCIWNKAATGEGGVRFYLSYSGSAPSGANCTTLAGDIESAWASHLLSLQSTQYALEEIDVLDIATSSGNSGQWSGNTDGTRSGTGLPVSVCTNVEYGIGRRYRGGKPRGFYPFGVEADLNTQAAWSSTFLTAVNTGIAAFMTALEALSVGSMGTLAHVNLSYYSGFTNHTNPSGRSRAVPTYRSAALLDTVTGYSAKATLGSQRRRLLSTTP